MKLTRFTQDGVTRIGKVVGEFVVDLSAINGVGTSMRQLLTDLPALRPALEAAQTPSFPLSSVKLEAPIADAQNTLLLE